MLNDYKENEKLNERIATRERKRILIMNLLMSELEKIKEESINRKKLQAVIMKTIATHNSHMVNTWIDSLVDRKYLNIDMNTINNESMKPSNRTVYLFNFS